MKVFRRVARPTMKGKATPRLAIAEATTPSRARKTEV